MRTLGPRMVVDELEGGFKPQPIPPGYELGQPPAGLPSVETLESFSGPWQQQGKYGRSVTAPVPRTEDAEPQVIFTIDRQNGPPRARTLHFFRSDAQIEPSGTLNADVYASVIYGVGGITNSFLCDWLRGGQLALVCDYLQVSAVPYAPRHGTPYNPPPDTQLQVLGCMLGHQGAPPSLPPTFTTASTTIPPSNSAVFTVPDFARAVAPIGSVVFDGTTNIQLVFRNLAAFDMSVVDLTEEDKNRPMLIPGGTTEIEITHGAGGSITNHFGLIFQLGL
jgi:hypothetical protein